MKIEVEKFEIECFETEQDLNFFLNVSFDGIGALLPILLANNGFLFTNISFKIYTSIFLNIHLIYLKLCFNRTLGTPSC